MIDVLEVTLCVNSTENTVHVSIEDTYERTLAVDGEETTLVVMDTWETEKQVSYFIHLFLYIFASVAYSLNYRM